MGIEALSSGRAARSMLADGREPEARGARQGAKVKRKKGADPTPWQSGSRIGPIARLVYFGS